MPRPSHSRTILPQQPRGIRSSESFIRVADLGHLSESRRTSHSHVAGPPPLVILRAFAASLGPAAAAAVSLSLGPWLFRVRVLSWSRGLARHLSGAAPPADSPPGPARRSTLPADPGYPSRSMSFWIRLSLSESIGPSLSESVYPSLSWPLRSGLGQSGSSSESFHSSHSIRAIYPSHSIRAIPHPRRFIRVASAPP